jgi:hypothetical protein
MVLQSSGAISLLNIQNEFGGTNPISLSEYYDAASGIPSSGQINFSDFHGKSASVQQNTYDDLKDLRSTFVSNNYNYNTSVNTIKSLIEGKGYDLIATPKYGNLAEGLTGTTNITSLGKFDTNKFTSSTSSSNYLKNSTGFSNNLLNDRPFMILALFDINGFKGFICMIFRSRTSALVRDYFYPTKPSNTGHDIYAFILNANGTELVNTSSSTKWNFSNNQSPGTGGYYLTTRFSADDGVWGVKFNSLVDGNTPGPRFSDSNSYGFENYNTGDASTTMQYYYWGNKITSTTHCAYVFVRRQAY